MGGLSLEVRESLMKSVSVDVDNNDFVNDFSHRSSDTSVENTAIPIKDPRSEV